MSRLSVVIVNYNVRFFLEQCLLSVKNASKNCDIEVFVVDNNSVDGSNEMVESKFPEVELIKNKQNVGFSVANNQAIKRSTGDFVLLLNPDTVVQEDTFELCLEFMESTPDAGGLGVKMIDGKGVFLPESKRGLPTPEVAFYKIFGLSSLFPKSKRFGRYHMGYASNDETHSVDVLSGAFMLMRKSVLNKIGLLDETFFMYGEDIDLSWRIKLGGYKNYYFPKTQIIHYKGESTKKSSINYVFVFYNAMVIFAKKHFSKSSAGLFSILINIAIWFRASLAVLQRLIQRAWLPLLDSLIYGGTLLSLDHVYAQQTGIQHPEGIVYPSLAVFALIFIASLFFNGGYDKPYYLKKIAKGGLIAMLSSLVIYSLLPEEYRFSRFMVLGGSLIGLGIVILLRLLLDLMKIPGTQLHKKEVKRIGIVGKREEIDRVKKLMIQTGIDIDLIIEILPDNTTKNQSSHFVGSIGDLRELVRDFRLNEIVFCAKSVSFDDIMLQMQSVDLSQIEYKIAPPEAQFIIGSNSINSSGELYAMLRLATINQTAQIRNKRLLDLGVSLVLLALSPILAWFNHPLTYFKSCFSVLFGQKTWVGYDTNDKQINLLPKIKTSVFNVSQSRNSKNNNPNVSHTRNIRYANDYKIEKDVQIILQNLNNLRD